MIYISIDGDDIGRKITSAYLNNDAYALSKLSRDLESSTKRIAEFLKGEGFEIIFCAADGVVGVASENINSDNLFKRISALSPEGVTFSAGVGASLREAYVALLSAKSCGKNCLHNYSQLRNGSEGM